MDVRQELREIRTQMASDFDFTALALKDMGQTFRVTTTDLSERIADVSKRMDSLGREMEERFNQLQGRMRLQEQRFGRMLDAVEVAMDEWKPEVSDLKQRVEALERRNPPAA